MWGREVDLEINSILNGFVGISYDGREFKYCRCLNIGTRELLGTLRKYLYNMFSFANLR